MYVIINIGECCHYQIEGGIFTEEALANNFVTELVKLHRYKREDLKVTQLKVDPKVADFPNDTLNRPNTAIWPKK